MAEKQTEDRITRLEAELADLRKKLNMIAELFTPGGFASSRLDRKGVQILDRLTDLDGIK